MRRCLPDVGQARVDAARPGVLVQNLGSRDEVRRQVGRGDDDRLVVQRVATPPVATFSLLPKIAAMSRGASTSGEISKWSTVGRRPRVSSSQTLRPAFHFHALTRLMPFRTIGSKVSRRPFAPPHRHSSVRRCVGVC